VKQAALFYVLKLAGAGVYYLATILLIMVDPKSGQILSFYEFHRPISGTIDLFSARANTIGYREYWQIIKNIFLVSVILIFIFTTKNPMLCILFMIYIVIFSLTSKWAILQTRSDVIKFKIKFYKYKTCKNAVTKFWKFKSQSILIMSTLIGSISYGYFYLSLHDQNKLISLRLLDLSGFVLSFLYNKYLIRRIKLSWMLYFYMTIVFSLLVIIVLYFIGIIFAIFVGLRFISGFICVKLFGYGRNLEVTMMTIITSIGYWIFHINSSEVYSLIVVLFFEVVALALGINALRNEVKLNHQFKQING
jgi:hypothetical protein